MRRTTLVLGLAVVATFAGTPPARGELQVSPAGVRMIESFEGFTATRQPDPVGVATIGYGTTTADVSPLPVHVTRAQAERLLRRSLDRLYMPGVRRLFRGRLRRLYSVSRADSLASGAYNLGTGFLTCGPGFASMCTALRSANAARIGAAIVLYNHAAGRVLVGLELRRRVEASPWLRPIGRFEDFVPHEVHLILSFDRLVGHPSPAAQRRRARLRVAIRDAASRVARVARAQRDWLSNRRSVRYAALLRRA